MSEIRKARFADKEQLEALWGQTFGEEAGIQTYFFQHVFQPEQTWCFTEEEEICAMLYQIPCLVKGSNVWDKAVYLYALATREYDRGRGIMHRLLAASLKEAEKAGVERAILIPAQESLTAYYRKFGLESMEAPKISVWENKMESCSIQAFAGKSEPLFQVKAIPPEAFLQLVRSGQWQESNENVRFDFQAEIFCLEEMNREPGGFLMGIYQGDRAVGYAAGYKKKEEREKGQTAWITHYGWKGNSEYTVCFADIIGILGKTLGCEKLRVLEGQKDSETGKEENREEGKLTLRVNLSEGLPEVPVWCRMAKGLEQKWYQGFFPV